MEQKLATFTSDEEQTRLLCEEKKMSGHRVMGKQKTNSEIPTKSIQQPAKADCLTIAVLSVLEAKVIDVLPVLGFLFLTYNVVDALFKANGDYGTISFVVCAYANLLALFYCLKSFEKLPEGESPKKTRLKVAIWTLASSLNLSFSYRVTSILDSVIMSSFVWTVAVATTVGAFYGLFMVSEERSQASSAEKPNMAKENNRCCETRGEKTREVTVVISPSSSSL